MQSHDFVFLKLLKTRHSGSPKVEKAQISKEGGDQTEKNVVRAGDGSLTLLSQIRDNYAVFQYENKKESINQKFGVNFKYYKDHQEQYGKAFSHILEHQGFVYLARNDLPSGPLSDEEKQGYEHSSGAYVFLPKWDDPLPALYG